MNPLKFASGLLVLSFLNSVAQPSAPAAIVFLGATVLVSATMWLFPVKPDINEARLKELEEKMNAVMLQRGMLG